MAVAKPFRLLRTHPIANLGLTCQEFRHEATGAVHLHLAADNSENVFLVALRTFPDDSTGVAHILEHTVLCGSERYPVRDPFFMMLRRSLNTFMNAFTGSDYTAYPFASQNRKDFFNLMDIYLDAVFFARLDPLDFAQEGYRLEFERIDDPTTPLVYRGVVYNEMKGDLSSPVSLLYETLKKHVFPTTTYHHNSGGDPNRIPSLTHEDLVSFYRSHYHPGNAVFMTFGDIPVGELQQRIDDQALSRFEGTPHHALRAVGAEERYREPLRIQEVYPLDSPADVDEGEAGAAARKTHIVLAWLLGPNTDIGELLRAHLLADLLLATGASPLRQALETTELGAAVSPLCGLEESNYEMTLICGIEGSDPDCAEALEALVFDSLAQVAADGLPQDRVDAVLHQLELQQREVGGDGYPYGLQLILAALPAAIHGGDPLALLDLDDALTDLREEAARPGFVQGLVKRWLIDNPHLVRLTLAPDPGLSGRREAALLDRMAAMHAALGERERRAILERAATLKGRQETEDDVDLLPKVALADVGDPRREPAAEVRVLASGPRVSSYARGTNGIVYHQVVTRVPSLEAPQLELLPIYNNVVPELGSGGRGYVETQLLQHGRTGGINCFTTLRGTVQSPDEVTAYAVLSGKALGRRARELMELLMETRSEVGFGESDRLRELVSQLRNRRQAAVTSAGSMLAMSAAARNLSAVVGINHRLTGLAGLANLKTLDDTLGDPARVRELGERLAALHERLRCADHEHLLITDPTHLAPASNGLEATFGGDRGGEAASTSGWHEGHSDDERVREVWVTDSQVSFCAHAYPTVPEAHPDSAALAVLGGVLRNGHLHRTVREQGGAYGVNASQDLANGVFRLSSYRDPQIAGTLQAFTDSIVWVVEDDLGFDQVEEAILGIVAGIDAPASPAGEARQAFHNALFGRSVEHRNRLRARILGVRVEDVKRVAAMHLLTAEPSVAILTGTEGLKRFRVEGDAAGFVELAV